MVDNMVDNIGTSILADDTQGLMEETQQTEEGESLSAILDEEQQEQQGNQNQSAEQNEQQNQQNQQTEPGWMKRKMEAYARKEVERVKEEMRKEYEAQFAPIRSQMFDSQAEALVKSGEFKTKATALEYVYLKNGMQMPSAEVTEEKPKPQTPPRDENGRFVATNKDTSPDIQERADTLIAQAKTIKSAMGIDVLEIYNSNAEVKQRILSGEWDFTDVAKAMGNGQHNRVPSPTRQANGVGLNTVTPATMTDAQFKRLQENLAQGKVYSVKR